MPCYFGCVHFMLILFLSILSNAMRDSFRSDFLRISLFPSFLFPSATLSLSAVLCAYVACSPSVSIFCNIFLDVGCGVRFAVILSAIDARARNMLMSSVMSFRTVFQYVFTRRLGSDSRISSATCPGVRTLPTNSSAVGCLLCALRSKIRCRRCPSFRRQ